MCSIYHLGDVVGRVAMLGDWCAVGLGWNRQVDWIVALVTSMEAIV